MASIDNVKKLSLATAQLGSAAGKVLEDGKISFSDMAYAMKIVQSFQEFVAVKYAELKLEFKDLDAAEKGVLVQAFNAEFDLPQDSVEASVERLYKLALDLYGNLLEASEIVKSWKAKA